MDNSECEPSESGNILVLSIKGCTSDTVSPSSSDSSTVTFSLIYDKVLIILDMINYIKLFTLLILVSVNSVFADTQITSSNPTEIILTDIVGGDSINITKVITGEHDANDTNIS